MSKSAYVDEAVFIPGMGMVLIAPTGSTMPTADELINWVKSDQSANLVTHFVPIGYTSEDDLPGFDTSTEGGEVKGAWENKSLRTTAVKTVDTVGVKPIQWTEEALKHRFGKTGTLDKSKGHFKVPDAYAASEVAMLVVLVDGDRCLGIGMPKVASAPDGGLSFDKDSFAALPIKYTVLKHATQDRMIIIGGHLKAG